MRVVWIRRWVVVATVVVFVAVALALSLSKPKTYDTTARMTYSPPTDASNPGSSSSVDVNSLTIQLQSVGNLITSSDVQSKATSNLKSAGQDAAGYSVVATVVTPASTTTAIADSVDVTAVGPDPVVAAAVANAYATAVIEIRKANQRQSLQAAQQIIQRQLDTFQSSQSKLSPDYASLSLQLRDLQMAEATATGDFVIVQPATPPSSPSSPKPVKSAVVGLMAGLFFGVAGAFVLGQFDVKLRSHREVGTALRLTVVGRLPQLPRRTTNDDELVAVRDPEGTFSEALRVLRTNLDWTNIDENLRVLLVSSCLKGEGKTLTLCNLAVTLARTGKRVVVVDADLRSPRVHRLFGLPNSYGLTSVALGRVALSKALVRFDEPAQVMKVRTTARPDGLGDDPKSWEGALHVLTSGPVPPNPGEVVASRSVASVITAISKTDVDYVLVDVPPLLGFGDAGALAPAVDGLLMVANIKKARRPTLEEGREMLETLPCRKVGVVVIGENIEDTRYSAYSSG